MVLVTYQRNRIQILIPKLYFSIDNSLLYKCLLQKIVSADHIYNRPFSFQLLTHSTPVSGTKQIDIPITSQIGDFQLYLSILQVSRLLV